MSVTPITSTTRPDVAGVDWAKDDHAVCIVGPDGEVGDRFDVTHTAAGLKTLTRRLLAAGVVALVLIAVAGIIVLEPYPVLFSDASHTAALDAMVSLILHV